MNPIEVAVSSASPLNKAGVTVARGNIRQPAEISRPNANPARTTEIRTPRPPRVTPGRAGVPAAANKHPVPKPGCPPRNPGPAGGAPRPGTRPPHVLYKPAKVSTLRRYCVPVTTAILVLASLVVLGILLKVVLDNYYFFCTKSFMFIPMDKWCDGKADCSNGEDESRCVQQVDFSNRSIVRLSDVDSILQILTSSRTWSYICSDGFDTDRAKAVCAEIGFASKPSFSSISAATLNGQFGKILLNDSGVQAIPITGACTSGNVISLKCIDCGINHKKERIVGGQDTSIESSPWQGSLQYMGQHSCGCSVLSQWHVLAAAHCFQMGQRQVERWRVEFGHTSLAYIFASQVDKIYIHTSYNTEHKPNDIAILKLKRELTFSATVQPICLPGFDSNLQVGTYLTVTGWGHTVEGAASLASKLQVVTVPLISNDACNKEYFGQIVSTMLCCGQASGGKDTCQGDSGGPLVSLGPNSCWQQNGIVSWGDGCARAGKAGVYTRVSAYSPWIATTMKLDIQLL